MGLPTFVAAYARKRFSPSFAQLKLLPRVESFPHAMIVLRRSFGPRARFLASTLARSDVLPSLCAWDEAIEAALQALFDSPDPPSPRCFVSGAGGLDIPLMQREHDVARINCWDRTSRLISKHFPPLTNLCKLTRESMHPVHLAVVDAWDSLPQEVKEAKDDADPVAPAYLGGIHPG